MDERSFQDNEGIFFKDKYYNLLVHFNIKINKT